MPRFSSIEFGTSQYVLKIRCKSILNPEGYELHKEFKKGSEFVAIGKYNVVALDDGECYYVNSQLEKITQGRKVNYKLSFSDMEEVLDNQAYRPLKTLGKKVFG